MVTDFISLFKSSEELFLNGMCYYFAKILADRFGGAIYYAPVENHFLTQICDKLYDASGEVTDLYPKVVSWEEYKKIDEIHADRIQRECILKVQETKQEENL